MEKKKNTLYQGGPLSSFSFFFHFVSTGLMLTRHFEHIKLQIKDSLKF